MWIACWSNHYKLHQRVPHATSWFGLRQNPCQVEQHFFFVFFRAANDDDDRLKVARSNMNAIYEWNYKKKNNLKWITRMNWIENPQKIAIECSDSRWLRENRSSFLIQISLNVANATHYKILSLSQIHAHNQIPFPNLSNLNRIGQEFCTHLLSIWYWIWMIRITHLFSDNGLGTFGYRHRSQPNHFAPTRRNFVSPIHPFSNIFEL